jgi:hypothetical protein
MVLITTYYIDKNPKRQLELDFVLDKNIQNKLISEIFLLCEQLPQKELPNKVSIINAAKRLKFHELIVFANQIKTDEFKILCNTDIFFDETLSLLETTTNNNFVYCLTRWDYKESENPEFYENFKSQDSWIFKGNLPKNIGYYFMGLPGCDNRFAKELLDSGCEIQNPSLTIKSVHVHGSNLRNYHKSKDRVLGEYAYPLPTELKNHRTKWGQKKEKEMLIKFLHRKWRNDLQGIEFSFVQRILAKIRLSQLKHNLHTN